MQIRSFDPRSLRSIFKWGAPDVFYDIDDRLRVFMQERLGIGGERLEQLYKPGLEQVPTLPPCALPDGVQARLEQIVGPENLSTDSYQRAEHSCGSTFMDLLRLRLGQVEAAPDAVVFPRHEEDITEVLAACDEAKVPLVPAGGRSSVTRALESPLGGVSLDLTRHLDQVLELNDMDRTARVQPGIYGPAYEARLNASGLTCGHFPQSFEFSTVGGWVAGRGAGQQSTYYGKIEDMVLGMRCVTPAGMLHTHPFPRVAMGPDYTQMLVGSEGTLGVISEVTLRTFPHRPESMRPLTFMFKSFTDGVECIREILQSGVGRPGVCRLSDAEETEVALTLDGLAGGGIDRTLTRLGYRPGERSLMIAATEGERLTSAGTAARARLMALKHGGLPLGSKPLRSWAKRRFHDPYLRDDLMDYGVLTDTLETSTTWSNLPRLWRGVRAVVKARPNSVCMTHISHAYDNGANLYFIVLTPMDLEQPLDDYRAYHRGIIDAVVANGGSLSHHHGVGRLFAPWYPAQVGPVAHGAFRALKASLDPNGIMNPGAYGLGMGTLEE